MQTEMLFWSCSDADGEQKPYITISVCRRRADVDKDRDPRSATVGQQCTKGRGSVRGGLTPVVHHTRSQLEWMFWIRLAHTGIDRQGSLWQPWKMAY